MLSAAPAVLAVGSLGVQPPTEVARPSHDPTVSIGEYPKGVPGRGDINVDTAAFAWLRQTHPEKTWVLNGRAHYRVSEPVRMDGTERRGRQLHGNGARITQTDSSKPVLAAGDSVGSSQVVKDLVLSHERHRDEQGQSISTAIGVAFRGNTSQSLFDNVTCYNVGKGFATAPTARNDIPAHERWESFFSNHVRGCRVQQFSDTAIELVAVGAGQTQNVFENIYLNNLDTDGGPARCRRAIHVMTMFGQVWNGLNVEHMICDEPVLFHQSQATINALHVEGVTMQAAAFISVFGRSSTLLVNGTFLSCGFGDAITDGSLFSVGPHTKVHWNGGTLWKFDGSTYVVGPAGSAVGAEFRRTNTTIHNPNDLAGHEHPAFPQSSYKVNESMWSSLEEGEATYRVQVVAGSLSVTAV